MKPRRSVPTLDDVARVAGVSRATASRAVRGGHLVSGSTQAAIDAAIKQLGYVPNQAARSLATRTSSTIAVVVSENPERVFHDPFFATSVAEVAKYLERTDWQMGLYLAYGAQQKKLEQYLRGGLVDAALVVSHHDEDRLAALFEDVALPCAFLGRPARDEDRESSFSVANRFADLDNVTGGQLAAQHLIERGCRRIATITGPMDIASARERLQGFKAALAEAGLQPIAVRYGDFEPDSAKQATLDLLANAPRFDGIFVASDRMAIASLEVLQAQGRRVPDDVRVIGFDDSPMAQTTTPTLSTVHNPWRALAVAATEMVLAELNGSPPAEPVILRPALVPRQSTT